MSTTNQLKISGKYVLIALITIVVCIYTCYSYVANVSQPYITNKISQLSPQKCAVVLGTSKQLKDGRQNLFFRYRIDAAVELYQSGKVEFIIVSGDNGTRQYNEPEDMKLALIARGISEEKIFLDYAGFRTLDSMVRAKEVFGQSSFIVVSQPFHNERAVFLARKLGVEAFGFNAKKVNAYNGFKTHLREYFARVKACLDIIFGVNPKFLGKPVVIQ